MYKTLSINTISRKPPTMIFLGAKDFIEKPLQCLQLKLDKFSKAVCNTHFFIFSSYFIFYQSIGSYQMLYGI